MEGGKWCVKDSLFTTDQLSFTKSTYDTGIHYFFILNIPYSTNLIGYVFIFEKLKCISNPIQQS